ncbi:MAG: LPS assembly lipoprotein LptE [Candidatus Omnitrophota bacterium]
MMRRRYWVLLMAACCITALAAGCGYTTRSMISDKFKTIYVVPFVNKIDITNEADVANKYRIYRPLLETDITRAVTNKYFFDGNLRPTKEELADLVLKGELMEFRKDPLRYTDNDNEVAEYRVNIIVNLSLWDRKENKVVWEEKNFTGDTTYFTNYSTTGTPKSEDQAVTDAISDLARRVVERTVEQW